MAAVAVCAELKFRDGMKETVSVNIENNLSSLIGGIHKLNENVSRLLSELVERERDHGACAEGELTVNTTVERKQTVTCKFRHRLSSCNSPVPPAPVEEEDSDEDDGEPEDPPKSELQPPAKRSKN